MKDGETVFSRYNVLRRLGRGGVGSVFLVEDRQSREGERRVKALKHVELPEDGAEAFDLIRSEFEILSRLEHPHLARAFEIGREGRTAYFTMEYVEGPTLLEALADYDQPEMLRLAVGALRALAFLHGLGLIHGDVKPQNILVDASVHPPAARLLDLGIAESVLGVTVRRSWGTPAYAAPEKFFGAPLDPRSDLYSFGVMLFQILTGRLPFGGDSHSDLLNQHRSALPPRPSSIEPDIPDGLDDVCLKLLEKRPRKRFPSAEAVISALAPFASPGVSEPLGGEGRYLIGAVFIGREGPLKELEEILTPSLEGSAPPSLVAIKGSGGIGKSRLAREFALNIRVKGFRVIEARCSHHLRSSLAPLADLVRPLSGRIQGLDPEGREIVRLFLKGRRETDETDSDWRKHKFLKSIGEVFDSASQDAGLLLVLEDFHLASPDLVEVLLHLATNGTRARLSILLTARENVETSGSVGRFLQGTARCKVKTIPLTPLGAEDVARWVETSLPGAALPPGTARGIAEWGEGNPFLIREALLAGMEEGRFVPSPEGWRFVPPSPGELFPPPGVQTDRRFSTLPPEERELVGALALHPGNLELGVLEGAMDATRESPLLPALRTLSRNGWLLEPRRGRAFSISNDRMRRPISRVMDRAERIRIHRLLARALEGREDESHVEAIAEHWARAGEGERAAEWCLRAGRSSFDKSMYRRALVFLRAGRRAALAAGWEAGRLGEIETALASSFIASGAPKRGESILREAAARDLPQSVRSSCLFTLGGALSKQGRLTESLAAFEEARASAEESGDSEAMASILVGQARILENLGRSEEGLEVLSRVLHLPRDDPRARGRILIFMGKAHFKLGRFDEGLDHTIEGLHALGKFRKDSLLPFWAYMQIGYGRLFQGRAGRALRWFEAARRVSERFDYMLGIGGAGDMIAEVAWKAGMPARAHEEVCKAQAAFHLAGGAHSETARIHFLIARDAPRHDIWLEKVRGGKVVDFRKDPPPYHEASSVLYWPSLYLRVGLPGEARDALEHAHGLMKDMEPLQRMGADLAEMEFALETGDAERALSLARAAEERDSPFRVSLPNVLLVKAKALADLGKHEEAGAAFREAESCAASMGLGGEIPRMHLFEARSALSRNDADRALDLALQAAEGGSRTGRPGLVWQAFHLAGLALDSLGKHLRASKFFRRSAWAMEAEALTLPEPYRSSFLSREDASDVARKATARRAEDAAVRLGRLLCRRIPPDGGDWVQTAMAWAEVCAGALGADAVVFHPKWPEASPGEAVFGNPRDLDDTWTLELGEESARPGALTLFRTLERGPFPPVAGRIAPVLTSRLSTLLERQKWSARVARMERAERGFRERLQDAETALETARRALTWTQTALGQARGFGEMIGRSEPMREVYEKIRRFAPSHVAVVVTGESGTGKELVAREIHAASRRRGGAFFAVNCASMAESLLESELFGHEKGAFTGADETHPGLFEQAFGGTLILDEVADMSPRMQAQVLRVLEEKKVRRIGGTEATPVDVRVIALTNRPLEKEVEAGRFRLDLYHRLNQASIELPPLRKRVEDIPLLIEYFASALAEGGEAIRVPRRVEARLVRHSWPGNVRELRNQLQRAALLGRGRALRIEDFPDFVRPKMTETPLSSRLIHRLREAAGRSGFAVEKRHEDLFRTLAERGSIRRAQYERLAGISTSTAWRDLERLLLLGVLKKSGRGRGTVYSILETP